MDTIKQTDVKMGKGVVLALSSYYHKQYGKDFRALAKLVAKALPIYSKHLNLPKNLIVRLGPIKSKTMSGRYHNDSEVAEVEVRFRTVFNLLSVLAHELVHAEQFHSGRLSLKSEYARGWVYYWHGEPVNNKGTTYERYRNQPWEKEAFSRQIEIAMAVAKELDIEIPSIYNPS